MMPIVNGFEAKFGKEMAFHSMNAVDDAKGQKAFDSLSLPGHLDYVIFTPAGEELYRSFGVVNLNILRNAITNALRSEISTYNS